MKLSRHNGRKGKDGAYKVNHNDRKFDLENAEHIDQEKPKPISIGIVIRGIILNYLYQEKMEKSLHLFLMWRNFITRNITQNIARSRAKEIIKPGIMAEIEQQKI